MIQSSKHLSHIITILFCLLVTGSSWAQTPIPPVAQGAPIQAPDIKPRVIPQRTVGIDPTKVLNWSLRDAIILGLERNVDIQLERENVRLAEYDLYGARGVYDPSFTSTL